MDLREGIDTGGIDEPAAGVETAGAEETAGTEAVAGGAWIWPSEIWEIS